MTTPLERDLRKALEMISSDWGIQSDRADRKTNFIYHMNSLQECLQEIERSGVHRDYALHRWYNYQTSVRCEQLFCECGAVHEKDVYHHDVDIYIDGIPFDVKLTVYPAKLASKRYDLKKRSGKNALIRWYYRNQSQQSRKQMSNRLYVVCNAESSYEKMAMKSNFDLMRERISAYMNYVREHGFNEITITDKGRDYLVKSDIIRLDSSLHGK